MGAKKRENVKAKAKPEKLTKRAEEARKKEMVHGEGVGRLKVLESCHCTGVLTSRITLRDVRIEQVTIAVHGKDIIRDAVIQINHGRRYGLIGPNGSGKTTFLAALACRELPIPDHIDIWHVHQEAEPTETTAIDAVVDVAAKEYERLENLIMKLAEEDAEGNADVLEALGEKQDRMDPATFVPEAGALLFGLGFSDAMMAKKTKDMSGGWRMRVALAQALFKKPTLLILDEPTNHLDLGACVWLEEYLANYPTTIVLTSHSEDFMNTVCTEIVQITHDQRLTYWGGNYEQYVKTREEIEVNQLKAYEKEQEDIKHLQDFIRSCGTYSNMRRQADSKQKIIDKMKEKGLTEKPVPDAKYMFKFPESESLAPPIMAFDSMSFSYSGKEEDFLYKDVNFGIHLDSRIALVGPNGAGKSTLLKLMRGDLEPVVGQVKRHSHLRIASYNQHSAEVLPLEKSPLKFFQDKFDAIAEERGEPRKSEQEWRSKLGKYGVTGDLQKRPMGTFSDGQKSRVVFALMSMVNPHLLLLDEPTNHLDMACIDALAEAILCFTGGTVLVSHDFRLIDKVAKEIWICDGGVIPWKGDIKAYKTSLSKQMKKDAKARMGNCKGATAGGTSTREAAAAKEAAEEEKAPAAPEPVKESKPEPAAAPEPKASEPAAPEPKDVEPETVEDESNFPPMEELVALAPKSKDEPSGKPDKKGKESKQGSKAKPEKMKVGLGEVKTEEKKEKSSAWGKTDAKAEEPQPEKIEVAEEKVNEDAGKTDEVPPAEKTDEAKQVEETKKEDKPDKPAKALPPWLQKSGRKK